MKMKQAASAALVLTIGLAVAGLADSAKKRSADSSVKNTFYVYSDKGARVNHFIPSGWMGDYGDIKIDDGNTNDPADGKTCIKITYSGKATQGANWAGIFWQHPANNWGDKPGGFDLSSMKRLTFWARGEEGGEKVAEFKVGGITGEHGDSDSASIGPVTLTKEWKKYTIDLADKNLSHIVGGFCWSASRDDNPNGFVIYLDEIRYEQ
ncbi:MAG TPA: hypothetical protein VMU17_05665 [Elusimicrobiota bacterium]|nr:hypothetical protein [Elusimicrobiota bacterium]